ncbi:hypothetical protein FEF34_24845 [Streptomyces marianii]|uniref:Uncharacterized protein n=2 Tax=Streptomyces marianii TaxID=1817406 RepID=A0A5R9EJ79_9ACTN|nr:hypothetical protein FEF34_24845 [Streptomyces marianii]
MLIRRRTYRAIIQRGEAHRLAAISASRTVAAMVRNADRRSAGMAPRLARALRACARYRMALAASERRNAQLQRRLDDALGLNSDAVAAGSLWQERRADRPYGAKP